MKLWNTTDSDWDEFAPNGGGASFTKIASTLLTNKNSFAGTSYEQVGSEEAEVSLAALPRKVGVQVSAIFTGNINNLSGSNYLYHKVQISLDGGSTWSDGPECLAFENTGIYGKLPVTNHHFLTGTATGNVQARVMAMSASGASEAKDLHNCRLTITVNV